MGQEAPLTRIIPFALALSILLPVSGAAAQSRDAVEGLSGLQVPRFVSLGAGLVNLRSGPGDRYPVSWVYKRRGLPVLVRKEYGIWRQIEDPDGAIGWVNKSLISGTRTGYVKGGVQPLRASPHDAAPVVVNVAEGVVGTLSKCASGWCRLTIGSRTGYIRTDKLWGAFRSEKLD